MPHRGSSEPWPRRLGGVAEEQGYEVTDHRLDLVGLCPDCRVLPTG